VRLLPGSKGKASTVQQVQSCELLQCRPSAAALVLVVAIGFFPNKRAVEYLYMFIFVLQAHAQA
jgi:hypothetical protein